MIYGGSIDLLDNVYTEQVIGTKIYNSKVLQRKIANIFTRKLANLEIQIEGPDLRIITRGTTPDLRFS